MILVYVHMYMDVSTTMSYVIKLNMQYGCHAIMIVMLLCCHVVMLLCCHVVMLSCNYVIMLLCYHVVMMSCRLAFNMVIIVNTASS